MTILAKMQRGVNDGGTHEMPGLDLVDFVGCILQLVWAVEVYTSTSSRESAD